MSVTGPFAYLGDNLNRNQFISSLIGLSAAITLAGCGDDVTSPVSQTTSTNAQVAPKAVYTLSNEAGNNRVLAFTRAANGGLTFASSTNTGGQGSADGLNGSSNSLVFDQVNNRFFCVNAGSNTISMLNLNNDGTLTAVTSVNSGGTRPISVTVSGNNVYVLNQAAPSNITGFQVQNNQLVPIAGSTQPLSGANTNPAQIQFSPSGRVLVVTERNTNNLLTYALSAAGVASAPQIFPAAGVTPFGFAFTSAGRLVVSNASVAGGAPTPGGSTVSTYTLSDTGVLTTVSSAVPTGGTAACWVALTRAANAFAYVTNTAGNTLSQFSVDSGGAVSGVVANAGSALTGPVDAQISDDDRFLYVLNGGTDTISIYGIGANGSLTQQPGINGLPLSSVGLVAR